MIYRAFMTGDMITPESAAEGSAAEMGWVDGRSLSTLEESRNYVQPVAEYDPRDPDQVEEFPTVAAWIASTVADWLGAAESNGDGTWYGQDSQTHDYSTGETFTYALHFHGKRHNGRTWVEESVLDDGTWYAGGGRYGTHVGGVEVLTQA